MRLAAHAGRSPERFPDEAAPHSLVDLARSRRRDDQWTQRARGSHEHGSIAAHRLDRGLKAERAERGADAIERGAKAGRLPEAGIAGELAAELDADLRPAPSGNGVERDPEQLDVVPPRKLQRLGLGRDGVPLRRTTRAGTAFALGERGAQVPGLHQPLETPAGDGARDSQPGGELVGGRRLAPASNERKRGAEVTVSNCL